MGVGQVISLFKELEYHARLNGWTSDWCLNNFNICTILFTYRDFKLLFSTFNHLDETKCFPYSLVLVTFLNKYWFLKARRQTFNNLEVQQISKVFYGFCQQRIDRWSYFRFVEDHIGDAINYGVFSFAVRADKFTCKNVCLSYWVSTSNRMRCSFFRNSSFCIISVGSLGKFVSPIDVTVLNKPFHSNFLTHAKILSLLNSLSL